jgi:hypothetical protein
MATWWYINRYDPFHLPTLEQVQTMGNYSAPRLYWLLEDLMFALCPGLFLQMFTIDAGPTITWFMWIVAALINGPIYYCVGLLLVALTERVRHQPQSDH